MLSVYSSVTYWCVTRRVIYFAFYPSWSICRTKPQSLHKSSSYVNDLLIQNKREKFWWFFWWIHIPLTPSQRLIYQCVIEDLNLLISSLSMWYRKTYFQDFVLILCRMFVTYFSLLSVYLYVHFVLLVFILRYNLFTYGHLLWKHSWITDQYQYSTNILWNSKRMF